MSLLFFKDVLINEYTKIITQVNELIIHLLRVLCGNGKV